METINIKGRIKFLAFGKTTKDEREMYRFTLEADNIDTEIREKLENVFKGASLVPKFITEKTNSINLKTMYDIPVKCADAIISTSRITSLEEFIDDGRYNGAEITCKIKLKDDKNAIYPTAILIRKLGTVYDAFEDME